MTTAPPYRFDVLTLFPGLFDGFLRESLIGKAVGAGTLAIGLHDWRRFAENKHGRVDDAPFGGGAGMVLAVGPVVRQLEAIGVRGNAVAVTVDDDGVNDDEGDGDAGDDGGRSRRPLRVMLSPAGHTFNHSTAKRYAAASGLVLLCGRYEGFDARVEDEVDELLSLGDYVLNGGEVAAMVVIEAVARLLPGVIGNAASLDDESHAHGLLEAPHYTRPRVFEDREVPAQVLSGDHGAIAAWRQQAAEARTAELRPDLHNAWLARRPPERRRRKRPTPAPDAPEDA